MHQVRIVNMTLICAAHRPISVDMTSLLFQCVFDTSLICRIRYQYLPIICNSTCLRLWNDRRVNDSSVRRILDNFHDPPVCGKSALFGQSILREIAVNLSEKRKREAGGTLNARNNFLSRQSQADNLSAFKEINNSNNLEDWGEINLLIKNKDCIFIKLSK